MLTYLVVEKSSHMPHVSGVLIDAVNEREAAQEYCRSFFPDGLVYVVPAEDVTGYRVLSLRDKTVGRESNLAQA